MRRGTQHEATIEAMVLGAFAGSMTTSALLFAGSAHADTAVYYDAYGTVVVVNVYQSSSSVVVYDRYHRPITIYPAHPAYVPGPAVGPASIRGQSRRVARRTSRRTTRRWN